MRIFKLAIISILILFVVLLFLTMLIPSHFRISRAVDINVSRDSIHNSVADLRRWKEWNDMVRKPEITNPLYTDSSFTSDQLQVHLKIASGDSVITFWTQPNGHVVHSGFTFVTSGGTTVVQWYFDIYPRWFPWEKLSTIVLDNQLGPVMEQSLENLKSEAGSRK